MGSGESKKGGFSISSPTNVKVTHSVDTEIELPPAKIFTRDEIIKALIVNKTTENGKEVIKSELLDMIRAEKSTAGTEFSWASIYDPNDPNRDDCKAKALGEKPFSDVVEDRAFGAMLGMAVGDAMGARLEFMPVKYGMDDIKDMGTGPGGKFKLLPGQWTDDTSMGLCVADSLLTKGDYDAHDMIHRFLAWWYGGLNNGHLLEKEGHRTSCGLGGLIKSSFNLYIQEPVAATKAGNDQSSGNGSLMRLAAVPLFYRDDIKKAEEIAKLQSYTTHQGIEAAECCRLMTHIMVKGLNGEDLHNVLDSLSSTFQTDCQSVRYLADSKAELLKDQPSKEGDKKEETKSDKKEETKGDKIDEDRDWNWKADEFKYSPWRVFNNPGYIGSYAMDGLAMALHILWSTSSLSEAILKAVNLRGDADTLAAIVGQIGGCFYGCSQIPLEWKQTVMQWDNNEIALRAYRLYKHELLQ